ncbi:MAG: hypothetical protein AB3N21_20650 [Ruegeria sp.]|uniref:hypothetical protein n=1 Tax=Ruegeria sp. TaxID=1879320 RepID=UPI00349F034D
MNRLFTLCALSVAGLPAFAGTQPDISDLVTDTIGYTTVRPGVVLLEGESMGTFICRFDVSDEDFQAFAASGELKQAADRVVCIPIEELEK